MLINLAQSPLLGNINKIIPKKVMKSFTKVFTFIIVDSFQFNFLITIWFSVLITFAKLHNCWVYNIKEMQSWDLMDITLLMGFSLHLGKISVSYSTFLINMR